MSSATFVRDHGGRLYRVGETDADLLGLSRGWMLWCGWAAMLAAGVAQYGFGAVVPVLAGVRGWSTPELFWALALWVVCQAGTAFPAAWLRDRGALGPVSAMVLGAVLCATGLVTLAHANGFAVVVLGYSVLGGIGTGLVYATALGTVVRWFPDRVSARVASVSGAFAYGAVPFVLVAGFLLRPDNVAAFLDVAAVVVLLVIAASGVLLKDPPTHWWPPSPQPREWALDKAHRFALRPYRPLEALRCGTFAPMYAGVVFAAAVSLFDLVYVPTFVLDGGGGPVFASVALSVLAGSTGGGRVLVGWISGRIGRRRASRWAMATGGLAQFVLLWSGQADQVVGLLIGAALAGLGTGCCYSLSVGLVREYFGETSTLQNFGVLYTAKAAGALLAAIVLVSQGYVFAFAAAGVLGLLGAVLAGYLSQPGRPQL
jgi:MFS family permease